MVAGLESQAPSHAIRTAEGLATPIQREPMMGGDPSGESVRATPSGQIGYARDMSDEPEYADPDRYIELTAFKGEYRDLWWNPDFLGLMARRWRLGRVRRALDVGCGAGHWTRTIQALLPRDAEVVGVDREAKFLELARATAADRGTEGRTRFEVAEAEALPFEDGSFDLVTCQTVLMHVADAGRVISEMIRVLEPGGLIVASEPDNLAGNTTHLNSHPQLSVDDRVAFFRFQAICEAGKIALGNGNSSIGSLLPGLFNERGLTEIRAHTNDRCLLLHPPYEDPAMKVALEQELDWARQSVSMFFGTRADAARFFRAGGGDETAFEGLWSKAEAWMRAFGEGIASGTFHAARGYVGYLVSGRKPTS